MQRILAKIMPAIFNPNHAPFAKAWSEFAARSSSSSGITTLPAVKVSSVSGYRSLLMAKLAGMLTFLVTSTVHCSPKESLLTDTRRDQGLWVDT